MFRREKNRIAMFPSDKLIFINEKTCIYFPSTICIIFEFGYYRFSLKKLYYRSFFWRWNNENRVAQGESIILTFDGLGTQYKQILCNGV